MSEEVKNDIKLPTGKRLVLSSSPHISTSESVRKIMLKVLLAMVPVCAAGVWFFGLRALWVIVFTTACCVGAEALWCAMTKKPVLATIRDCSAAVTGVLLALNLPAGVPFYVPLIGAFLAIWLGKQIFGGLGHNPFNPALVARVGLLIAIPAAMTSWTPPRGMDQNYPELKEFRASVDATTCATPLGVAGQRPKLTDRTTAARINFSKLASGRLLLRFFWGVRGGCIGETCVPALLLGGLILFAFNLINWRVPLCFAGTVALFTGIVNICWPGVTPPPLFHLLTGGLLLGAIFMATDMVTCPITGSGCVVFAIGCGIITSVIRIWGNYPEGVSFSILFMNALVPLIDRWCTDRPFGYVRKRKSEVRK
jgi:electron transport complex protein RnfD